MGDELDKTLDLLSWSPPPSPIAQMRAPFIKYHTENPHIWDLFCRFAFEALNAGRTVLSANLIFERVRWETYVVTRGDGFKLNNNYRADYARFFMLTYPRYGEAFRTRELRAGQGEPYYGGTE